MNKTAAVILLGFVAVFSLVALSLWIIEGPRRLMRQMVK
jgi:hypothetical protein